MSADPWFDSDEDEPEEEELEVVEAIQDFWYLVKPEPWMADAACKGKTEYFFLKPGQNSREAKRICGSCTVKAQCEVYAEETDSEGIWAGEVRTPTKPSTVQDARPQVITITPRRTESPPQHPGFGTIAARRATGE